MRIKKEETILFIGNSITDCGRRNEYAPLGNGYVRIFADMLATRHPGRGISVINRGISGQAVTELNERWHDDVIRRRPDWISIKIGINDALRVLRHYPNAVPPSLYRTEYETIIRHTRKRLPRARLLLIDPFYLSTDKTSGGFRAQVLKLLPEYIRIVRQLAHEYNTLHIATHTLFQRLLKVYEPEYFCDEPVHPNATGHLVIADAVYRIFD